MPVDSHSHSGVWAPSAGSRIVARGINRGWRNASLTLVCSLVTPAIEVNSPPAIVVGALIWRTVGAFNAGDAPPTARILSMPSTSRDIIGEAELHRLGAVGDRSAADGDDEIGLGGAGLIGGRDHGRARRVRRHRVEGADAARSHRAADVLDHVGLAVERAADHQETRW